MVWTLGQGFSDRAIFEFQGFWNGAPSASWRLSPGQSFQAVFISTGTFTYNVQSVSGGTPVGKGTIRVADDPPLTVANLWVSMRPNQTGVTVGDSFAYDIFLDNVGLMETPVTLTDTIPSPVSFLSVSCVPLEGSSCPGPVYSPTLNSILWTGMARPTRNPDTGELTGNPSQWFRLGVKVESASGPFTNTVVVSSGPITMTASALLVANAPPPTSTPTPTPTSTPPVPTPTAVIIPLGLGQGVQPLPGGGPAAGRASQPRYRTINCAVSGIP